MVSVSHCLGKVVIISAGVMMSTIIMIAIYCRGDCKPLSWQLLLLSL